MAPKIKVTNKKIADHLGSAQQFSIQAREALWAIVETIVDAAKSEEEEQLRLENDEIEAVNRIEMQDMGDLPVQFGSKPKRRKKNKYHKVDKRSLLSSIPPYDGTLIEHNIFKLTDRADDCWCRVLGVGRSLPPGSHSQVQVLSSAEVIEVRRSSGLIALNCADLQTAARRVQSDFEWRQAQHCPPGVHLKYWDQRYRLLSRYDEGVALDAESWYSITPERIARQITQRCIQASIAKNYPLNTVFDLFSGCGGNTIPFAYSKRVGAVVSVDLDAGKLESLRHNASIYGAGDKISTECADVWPFLESYLPSSLSRDRLQQYLLRWYEDQGLLVRSSSTAGVDTVSGSGSHVRFDGDGKEEFLLAGGMSDREHPTEDVKATASLPACSDVNIPENTEVQRADGDAAVQEGAGQDSSDVKVNESATVCAAKHPQPDLIVMSPPWGGPDYCAHDAPFDLASALPCGDGLLLLGLAAAAAKNVVYLLPKNADDEQLARLKDYVKKPLAIENVYLNNSCKVKVVYVGTLFKN